MKIIARPAVAKRSNYNVNGREEEVMVDKKRKNWNWHRICDVRYWRILDIFGNEISGELIENFVSFMSGFAN